MQVERVQNKLLPIIFLASYVLKMSCSPSHGYSPVENLLGLSSSTKQRRTAGIRFIEGLLNGKVKSTELVSLICFKAPQRFTNML